MTKRKKDRVSSAPKRKRRSSKPKIGSDLQWDLELLSDSPAPSTRAKTHTATPSFWIKHEAMPRSEVYDTYWRFAAERQAIFFRRISGQAAPWTLDPILERFKFTNAYRASDRVSQYLIRHVIYSGTHSPDDVFFRIMLFKLFNRIETWELLEHTFGEVSLRSYRFDLYDRALTNAMARGDRIYSAAYIMPSGPRTKIGSARKHTFHLRLLERMVKDSVPTKLGDLRSMRDAFRLLRSYESIGDFLAYQYVTDVNYSDITSFSETEFVVPGPGALDGLRKCFRSLGGMSEADVIRLMADQQEREFERIGVPFQTLWGRALQLIDCQNLFCEVGKYARVRHPEIQGVSDRTRIKQHFIPKSDQLAVWYPPKWGINKKIVNGQTSSTGIPTDAARTPWVHR